MARKVRPLQREGEILLVRGDGVVSVVGEGGGEHFPPHVVFQMVRLGGVIQHFQEQGCDVFGVGVAEEDGVGLPDLPAVEQPAGSLVEGHHAEQAGLGQGIPVVLFAAGLVQAAAEFLAQIPDFPGAVFPVQHQHSRPPQAVVALTAGSFPCGLENVPDRGLMFGLFQQGKVGFKDQQLQGFAGELQLAVLLPKAGGLAGQIQDFGYVFFPPGKGHVPKLAQPLPESKTHP